MESKHWDWDKIHKDTLTICPYRICVRKFSMVRAYYALFKQVSALSVLIKKDIRLVTNFPTDSRKI